MLLPSSKCDFTDTERSDFESDFDSDFGSDFDSDVDSNLDFDFDSGQTSGGWQLTLFGCKLEWLRD